MAGLTRGGRISSVEGMRKLLSSGIAGALIASSLAVAAGPATAAPGRLVSAIALHTYASRADVDAALTADKFDPGTDRYGVRTYRLVFHPNSMARLAEPAGAVE